MARPEDYRFVYEILVTEDHCDALRHVSNVATATILDEARMAWFREVAHAPGPILVRNLTIDYPGQAFAGETLQCGVRAIARTARSITLDLTVWERESRRVVNHCQCVHVAYDLERGVGIQLWPSMVSSIEAFQERPLEITRSHGAPGMA